MPTNPTRTSLPWETLGFRSIGFSPMFSLLMPTFSLIFRPPVFSLWLLPTILRSPTHIVNYMTQFRLYALVPVYFRRGAAWPVSYYALFQGMAASKPTSWLSQQLYLLNHLAYIRDLNWRSGLFPSWPRILALAASLHDNNFTGIRSLTLFGTTFRRPHKTSALPPVR